MKPNLIQAKLVAYQKMPQKIALMTFYHVIMSLIKKQKTHLLKKNNLCLILDDHTIVKLKETKENDYINANYIVI